MSAPGRSTEWARELLAGRVVWQPLGVTASLWARFGWLAPWLTALAPSGSRGHGPNAAIYIMIAALLGHVSAVLVNRLDLPALTAGAGRLLFLLAVLGAGWLAFVGGLPGDPKASGGLHWQATWAVALCLGYAWWGAGRLSLAGTLEPESTLHRLFTGTLLAAAAFILFPAASRSTGSAFLPTYIWGGLVGVALGQVYDATRRRGGRPLPFGLSWHAALLSGVTIVVLLGVGLGSALSGQAAWSVAEAAARTLAGAARLLGLLLAPILEAILRLVGPVFDALIRLLQSLTEGAAEVKVTIPEPVAPPGGEGAGGEGGNQALVVLGVLLRILVPALGVAVLLWMAVRTTRWPQRTLDAGEPETVERMSEATPRRGGQGVGALLRSAIRLPGRARGLYHALRVRRVYAQLLEWAADEGCPRRPAETPLEFGIAFASLRPELRQDLDTITQAYLRVRYGELPENPEMVRSVLASWERLRRGTYSVRPNGEGNSR